MMEDKKECFDVSLRLRNLEIELFWKRALFFWGFIASAFWCFIVIKEKYPDYAVLIVCFGCICSFFWTLINRGSKRWQENWEQNSDHYGKDIVGDLLRKPAPIQKEKCWWLRARKFSPSKLAILLSDYTFFIWFILLLNETISFIKECKEASCLSHSEILAIITIIITIVLIPLTCKVARTSKNKNK